MWAERATRESIASLEPWIRDHFERAARRASKQQVDLGEEAEAHALKTGLAVTRLLFETELRRDAGHCGPRVDFRTPGGDVVELPFQGYVERTWVSAGGLVTFPRAYYHLDGTDCSRWPLEERLGLVAGEEWSPLLQRWALEDAVDGSFKPAMQKLSERFGLKLSYTACQTLCTTVGTLLAEQQQRQAASVSQTGSHPEFEDRFAGVRPEMLVVTTDGTGAPVRDYEEKTREVKLGAVYPMSPATGSEAPSAAEAYVSAGLDERHEEQLARHMELLETAALQQMPAGALPDEETAQPTAATRATKAARGPLRLLPANGGSDEQTSARWQKVPDATRYVATTQSSKTLGVLLYWLAVQMGYLQAKTVVFLADGAKWCWNEMRTHFPDAVGILDYFHLREKVEEAARLLFGDSGRAAVAAHVWARCVTSLLLHGKVDRVIQILKQLKPVGAEKLQGRHLLLTYLVNNREQTDYPRYLALGLPIGSGVVEGGAKHVIGARLKGSGRRWNLQGAAAMATLRAVRCSHWLPQAWRSYREERLAA